MKENILATIFDTFSESDLKNLEKWHEAYKNKDIKPPHLMGRYLDIEWINVNKARMLLGISNKNRYNNFHGGALFTLCDLTIAEHIFHLVGNTKHVSTLELKINYLKSSDAMYVTAESHILHLGKTTVVADCCLYDANSILIAKASGTFFLKEMEVSNNESSQLFRSV